MGVLGRCTEHDDEMMKMESNLFNSFEIDFLMSHFST